MLSIFYKVLVQYLFQLCLAVNEGKHMLAGTNCLSNKTL